MAIWSKKGTTKKFHVKIKLKKLEGFMIKEKSRNNAKMGVQIKWEGNMKSGLHSLYKKSHQSQRIFSKEVEFGEPIEWNDDAQFENVCIFSKVDKFNHHSFAPWFINFDLLYGDREETSSSSRANMQVIGKSSLNLGELGSKEEAQIEHKIPIFLEVDGVTIAANLLVLVSFIEMRNNSHSRTMSHESIGSAQNSSVSSSILMRANSQGAALGQQKAKRSRIPLFGKQLSWRSSRESSPTLSSESEYVVVASSSRSGKLNSVAEIGTSESSEAQLDLVKKGGFWKWKRRKSMKKAVNPETVAVQQASNSNNSSTWEIREFMCRDGKTKLRAEVFFASYDQRSDKAAGESACAAIVAVIAHRLQSNHGIMLTGPEFDQLITEGSSEWRKLCRDEHHRDFFPDKHFDLETVLKADLRPLVVNESHFGFFYPEEFEHIKEAKSFDEIWNDINKDVNDFESKIYIISWNDHFFIMKIEANANYIIDSLGERLYEGCNQAYILKFDDSTVMYINQEGDRGEVDVICRGKECCREYMKRFLAAIPLRELKEQEAKGKTVEMFALYQRLQIDFHLSTPSSSNSTANTSLVASPNTSPVLLGSDLCIY